METKRLEVNEKSYSTSISAAAEILKSGGIVAIPTETVYGLAASAYDENAIKNSITNILLTHRGKMPGRPTFGSRIMQIPFSQNDEITKVLLKRIIEEALVAWEDRIKFNDVEIIENKENKLVADIKYYFKDTGMNGSVSITLLE